MLSTDSRLPFQSPSSTCCAPSTPPLPSSRNASSTDRFLTPSAPCFQSFGMAVWETGVGIGCQGNEAYIHVATDNCLLDSQGSMYTCETPIRLQVGMTHSKTPIAVAQRISISCRIQELRVMRVQSSKTSLHTFDIHSHHLCVTWTDRHTRLSTQRELNFASD